MHSCYEPRATKEKYVYVRKYSDANQDQSLLAAIWGLQIATARDPGAPREKRRSTTQPVSVSGTQQASSALQRASPFTEALLTDRQLSLPRVSAGDR
jgi:hypothetical protein